MRLIETIKLKLKEWIDDYKEQSKERRRINNEIRTEAKQTYIEESKKQAIATAKFKAQQQGQKKRKYIKDGGFAGAISREADKLGKSIPKGKHKPSNISEMPQLFPKEKQKPLPDFTKLKLKF